MSTAVENKKSDNDNSNNGDSQYFTEKVQVA